MWSGCGCRPTDPEDLHQVTLWSWAIAAKGAIPVSTVCGFRTDPSPNYFSELEPEGCSETGWGGLTMKTAPTWKKAQPIGCGAAFTLTELLVVLAVLALLVVTQLPALTRSHTPTKLIQCQNNLRLLGAAALMYKDANADTYPVTTKISGP